MRQQLEKHKQQGIRFAVVGIATAIIYFSVLYGLIDHLGVSILVASTVAYLLAISINYVMHYRWTFRSGNPHATAIRRFIIMNTGGFFINLAIMSLGASTIPEYYLLVQLLAIGVIVVWNYLFSSAWVYKHKLDELPAGEGHE